MEPGSRISLGNEQRSFVALIMVGIEMYLTIPFRFLVVQGRFFCPVVGQFLNTGNVFAFTLRLHDPFQQCVRYLRMLMQVIIRVLSSQNH